VEFSKKLKAENRTALGRLTGMEPYTLIPRWYPAKDTYDDRAGIEGFYLLETYPVLKPSEG
jgi:hypothetical protein